MWVASLSLVVACYSRRMTQREMFFVTQHRILPILVIGRSFPLFALFSRVGTNEPIRTNGRTVPSRCREDAYTVDDASSAVQQIPINASQHEISTLQ